MGFYIYALIVGKIQEIKEKKVRKCINCAKYHTNKCPNSLKCYETKNKPFFKEKEVKE